MVSIINPDHNSTPAGLQVSRDCSIATLRRPHLFRPRPAVLPAEPEKIADMPRPPADRHPDQNGSIFARDPVVATACSPSLVHQAQPPTPASPTRQRRRDDLLHAASTRIMAEQRVPTELRIEDNGGPMVIIHPTASKRQVTLLGDPPCASAAILPKALDVKT